MPGNLSISIITPTFNRAHMLAGAIESVQAQGVDGVEHIIIDAMSDDGTSELLAGYPHLNVMREADEGIYDGVNKGLNMAKGDILIWLNSDDLLMPGALKAIVAAFAANPNADMVSGTADLVEAGTDKLLATYDKPQNRRLDVCNALLGLPVINARAFKRDLWQRLGGFDTNYPVIADRVWLARAAMGNAINVEIPDHICRYQAHDESLTYSTVNDASKRLARAHEGAKLARQYLAGEETPELLRTARILHDRSCASAMVASFKSGRIGDGMGAVWDALRVNPLWPLVIATLVISRALGLKGLENLVGGCPQKRGL